MCGVQQRNKTYISYTFRIFLLKRLCGAVFLQIVLPKHVKLLAKDLDWSKSTKTVHVMRQRLVLKNASSAKTKVLRLLYDQDLMLLKDFHAEAIAKE